jgi:hypothetical protein
MFGRDCWEIPQEGDAWIEVLLSVQSKGEERGSEVPFGPGGYRELAVGRLESVNSQRNKTISSRLTPVMTEVDSMMRRRGSTSSAQER